MRFKLRRNGVPPSTARAIVVRHVPGRLFEIAGQPAPFEDLRQDLGRLLTREVDTPELGHRVVAVFQEDPLVQLLGTADVHPRRSVDGT